MTRLLDPEALARIDDLGLIARTVADGFLQGVQPSQYRGAGIEFSQYRSYEPGDAPSHIDWKLFARSDRYYVREAERDSDLTIWLILDTSQSMALKSEQGVWSKFDYGRHLLATLAYVCQRQGDRVGLMLLGGQEPEIVPPQAGLRHWYRILHALENSNPAGTFSSIESLATVITRLQRRGLVVMASDLHQQVMEMDGFLRSIAHRHNDVSVMLLTCEDEVSFPFQGSIRIEDLETGERVLLDARAAKNHYLRAREAWLSATRQRLMQWDIAVDPINVDEALDRALYAFMQRRLMMHR